MANVAPNPIDQLVAEHAMISHVLEAMRAGAERLRTGGPFDERFWRDSLEFSNDFTDGSHHHKEEQLLFPVLLEIAGPVLTPPVCSSNHGHVEARRILDDLTKLVRGSPDAPTKREIARSAERYVVLLREHIAQENEHLFVVSKQQLRQRQIESLNRAFAGVDSEERTSGRYDRHRVIVARLAHGTDSDRPD